MSHIKTMKAQAAEAGAVVSNPSGVDTWPVGGIVNIFCAMEDVTSIDDNVLEDITESGGADQFLPDAPFGITNNGDGTCTGYFGSDFGGGQNFPGSKPIRDNSFIIFAVMDYEADFAFGGGINIISMDDNNSATFGNGFKSSGESMTAARTDQLYMAVFDRENESINWFEGTNGNEPVGTVDGEDFTFGNVDAFVMPVSQAFTNCFGMGILIFPNGIPENYTDMMQYIATELRAGRKYAWMNNFLDRFVL